MTIEDLHFLIFLICTGLTISISYSFGYKTGFRKGKQSTPILYEVTYSNKNKKVGTIRRKSS